MRNEKGRYMASIMIQLIALVQSQESKEQHRQLNEKETLYSEMEYLYNEERQ